MRNFIKIFGLILFLSVFTFTLQASYINFYYTDYSLIDSETDEKAQGIKTAGFKGDLYGIFRFNYERPKTSEQKSLSTFSNRKTDLENYIEILKLGMKPFQYFTDSNSFFHQVLIEYEKDIYQINYDRFSRFYTQELLFVGFKGELSNRRTGKALGSEGGFGLFVHNNQEDILIHSTGNYYKDKQKGVLGLLFQLENFLIPLCEEPRRKRRGFLETPDCCPDIIKA